jgi:hypothetical protein
VSLEIERDCFNCAEYISDISCGADASVIPYMVIGKPCENWREEELIL